MKKRILVLLAILLFGVSVVFAASAINTLAMKTFKFGPSTYSISEYAPEFLTWPARPIAETLISGPPDPCAIDAIEGRNEGGTVRIALVRLLENGSVYIVAVMVAYTEKGNAIDIYEDLGLIQTGKPSFKLTKVDKPSDIEVFIAAKAKQHKRTSGGDNIRLWEI